MASALPSSLPDPDDRGAAWVGSRPAFLAWWEYGEAQPEADERDATPASLGPRRALRALDFAIRNRLFERYAYAVPTNEALEALGELAPLVEVGAGAGYWARLLRDRGVEILATDIEPPDRNSWFSSAGPWTAVEQAGVETIGDHPDRTVFVCWPPRPAGFMPDLLRAAQGRSLAIVTDALRPGLGHDDLGAELRRGWTQAVEIPLPTTPIAYRGDSLTIWRP